jgi:hypothetical protein
MTAGSIVSIASPTTVEAGMITGAIITRDGAIMTSTDLAGMVGDPTVIMIIPTITTITPALDIVGRGPLPLGGVKN